MFVKGKYESLLFIDNKIELSKTYGDIQKGIYD